MSPLVHKKNTIFLLEHLIYLKVPISVADFLRFVRLHHAPLNIWLSVIPLLFHFFPPAGGFCCLFKLSSLICYAQNVHVPVETGQGAVWAWHVGHSNEAALHMQHVCLDARNLETRLGPSSSSSCHLVIVVVHLLILLQCFCFIHQAAEELRRLSFPFYSQHFRFTLSSVPVGCIYVNFVA